MVRVVSLLASATEIVWALRGLDRLVGRSHECDFPSEIRALPVCTRPRFPVDGPSADIDAQVKALLAAGSPLYEVDAELMRQLRPDVILTQSQCIVCAVSDDDVARALIPGLEPAPRVLSLAPNNLADLWGTIIDVAEALGLADRGDGVVQALQGRVTVIATKSVRLERPTVGCLEWLGPLMSAGNWVPELVELAGGTNVLGVAGQHSPYLSWEQLLARDPDVLIALPCGFDLERTRTEMSSLANDPRFGRLRAARAGRVYVSDGNQFFNRPGPRLVESLEVLAEILHPQHFDYGHEGHGWQRYPT